MKKIWQHLCLPVSLALATSASLSFSGMALAGPAKLGDYQTKGFLSSYEHLQPEGGDSEPSGTAIPLCPKANTTS